MSLALYVPRDSAAVAVGADAVAQALLQEAVRRGVDVHLVRNGSRGLYWLEPLVEVQTPQGRIGYGPVNPADAASLLDAFLSDDKEGRLTAHPLCVGVVDDIPFLKQQQRLTFARVGIVDPLSLDDFLAYRGYQGLRHALTLTSEAIVAEVTESGLRGRGGAAFPAGIKWRTALQAPGSEKYIVCNADEGDSGSFSDRMLMEGDPFTLLEGMTIAALAVGAKQGYVYVRSEYPAAEATLHQAIAIARAAGYLGADILGSGRAFDIELRRGAGAYICGEETALLESIEGRRGQVRARPPLPAVSGLFGQPTVVNNVITLATVPIVLERGARYYADFGQGRSRGTLPFQLGGNIRCGGLIELSFGPTLRTLLHNFGGGSASGRAIRAVQVGGPLGAWIPESLFDTHLDYEAFAQIGAMLGHGGVVVFDDTVDMAQRAREAMRFCAQESCGKCTPCRIGAVRGVEVLDRISGGEQREANLQLLHELCETMTHGSLCAMGGLTPSPVLSALKHFPEDFGLPASRGAA